MANKKAPRNTLPGEVWMDIPFSNGDYSISSLGRIYNNRYTRFITPSIGNSGYQYVFIYKKHFFVHRLLAHSFLGMEIDSSMVINHIDGIKTHNELTNIEISTPFLNARHAFVNGLSSTGRCFDRRRLGDVPRRLRHFVDDVLKISHVNFEQATGISRRILYEKTNKIEARTMKKLTSAYPLNPDWVRYGTGDMLLE